MVARLQGFPDTWEISGRKTAAYRQVGNAFPPPVAKALGMTIAAALNQVGEGERLRSRDDIDVIPSSRQDSSFDGGDLYTLRQLW
jgi:DNA (cytosine-5)-methyltransferase 1